MHFRRYAFLDAVFKAFSFNVFFVVAFSPIVYIDAIKHMYLRALLAMGASEIVAI